jgi:hypothetical protein
MLLWKRNALTLPRANNSHQLRNRRPPRVITSHHTHLPSITLLSFTRTLTASSSQNTQNSYFPSPIISTKAEQTMGGLATVNQIPPEVSGRHANDVPFAMSTKLSEEQHETYIRVTEFCDQIKAKWPADLGQESWYLVLVSSGFPFQDCIDATNHSVSSLSCRSLCKQSWHIRLPFS